MGNGKHSSWTEIKGVIPRMHRQKEQKRLRNALGTREVALLALYVPYFALVFLAYAVQDLVRTLRKSDGHALSAMLFSARGERHPILLWSGSLAAFGLWNLAVAAEQKDLQSLLFSLFPILYAAFSLWVFVRIDLRRPKVHAEDTERMLSAIYHLGVPTAVLALAQSFFRNRWGDVLALLGWYPWRGDSGFRASGTFENPNFAAVFFVFFLFLGAGLIERSTSTRLRLVYAGELFLYAIALLLTGSRGGMVGLAAGLVLYAVLFAAGDAAAERRREANLAKKLYTTPLTHVGVALFSAPWLLTSAIPRFSLWRDSLAERGEVWRKGLELFREAPWTGHGLAAFAKVPPEVLGVSVPLPHAHNLVLSLLVDSGVLGLFLLVPAFYLIVRVLGELLRRNHPWGRPAAAFFLALFVHGLVDFPFFSPQVALLVIAVQSFLIAEAYPVRRILWTAWTVPALPYGGTVSHRGR